MNGLSHHPAPARGNLSALATAFVLYTGPLAWFAQFCAGVALADWPCFPDDSRRSAPLLGYEWTRPIAVIVAMLALAAMAVALAVAYRAYRAVQADEEDGGHHQLIEIGGERTHFVALWGICLNLGFAVATLLGLVAFVVMPRCAG